MGLLFAGEWSWNICSWYDGNGEEETLEIAGKSFPFLTSLPGTWGRNFKESPSLFLQLQTEADTLGMQAEENLAAEVKEIFSD